MSSLPNSDQNTSFWRQAFDEVLSINWASVKGIIFLVIIATTISLSLYLQDMIFPLDAKLWLDFMLGRLTATALNTGVSIALVAFAFTVPFVAFNAPKQLYSLTTAKSLISPLLCIFYAAFLMSFVLSWLGQYDKLPIWALSLSFICCFLLFYGVLWVSLLMLKPDIYKGSSCIKRITACLIILFVCLGLAVLLLRYPVG